MTTATAIARERDLIVAGIARGVYADLWACEQEERGKSFSGQNIDDVAPKTPRWAIRWARKLAKAISEANDGQALDALYDLACDAGYPHDAEQFGLHLGMQATGAGISYSDDCDLPSDAIEIPYREFYRGVER